MSNPKNDTHLCTTQESKHTNESKSHSFVPPPDFFNKDFLSWSQLHLHQGSPTSTPQAPIIMTESNKIVSNNKLKKSWKRYIRHQRKQAKEVCTPQAKAKQKKKRRSGLRGAKLREVLRKKLLEMECAHIVFDCSFGGYMDSAGITQLSNQICRSYALMSRSVCPSFMYVTDLYTSNGEQRQSTALGRQLMKGTDDKHSWVMHFEGVSLLELYRRKREEGHGEVQDIVYLSAESESELEEMDAKTMYVIGGLVDHNAMKGKCRKVAEEEKIRHARLPVFSYMKYKEGVPGRRSVFTVNCVFEILHAYWNTKSWRMALFWAIPNKIGLELKQPLTKEEVAFVESVLNFHNRPKDVEEDRGQAKDAEEEGKIS